MIGTAIAEVLRNAGTIEHFYADRLPQSTPFPAVTFRQISGVRDQMFGAQQPSGTALVDGRWQFDVWAESLREARAVAALVRAAFHRNQNYGDDNPLDLTPIIDTYLEDESEDWDDSVKKYFVTHDYRVWWRE